MAVEAFYVDGWVDLEEAAAGLEQTARYLTKSTEQPPVMKDKLADDAKVLAKDAFRLRGLLGIHVEQVQRVVHRRPTARP